MPINCQNEGTIKDEEDKKEVELKIKVQNFKPNIPMTQASLVYQKRQQIADYNKEQNQNFLQKGILSSSRLYN